MPSRPAGSRGAQLLRHRGDLLPGRALGGCDGRTRRGQRASLRAQRARGVGGACTPGRQQRPRETPGTGVRGHREVAAWLLCLSVAPEHISLPAGTGARQD